MARQGQVLVAGAVGVIALSLATCTVGLPITGRTSLVSGATGTTPGAGATRAAAASRTGSPGRAPGSGSSGVTGGGVPRGAGGDGRSSGDRHGTGADRSTGGPSARPGPAAVPGLADPGWVPAEDGGPAWPVGDSAQTPGGGAPNGKSTLVTGPVTGSTGGPGGPSGQATVPGDGTGTLPPSASTCPPAGGAAVNSAPGSGRTIALTFDDGPGPQTRAVLDVLAAERVHATFFVVGAAVHADPGAVARASTEGHLIANHTWDHAYPRTVRHGWTTAYLTDQLTRTDTAVAAATGRPTCFFRPPGGFMPASVGVTGRALRERVVLWSVDPRDWAVQGAHDPGPDRTAAEARQIYLAATAGRSQAHPVLLLHDAGGYRGASVLALPRIIAFYRSLGYRFVRLDGLS